MSVSLNWYKPPTERKSLGSCGTRLKYILAEHFGQTDGSLHSEFALSTGAIPFVQGLVAAGVEDADKLLKDLQKYRSLDVIIE